MALRVFPFERTNILRNDYPWEKEYADSRYYVALIGPGYVYDQAHRTYEDFGTYVVGNPEPVNPEFRRITIESGGDNTIYRSGKLGFTTNTQALDAIGQMIFIVNSTNISNDNPVFMWISFGETLTFNTTDSVDGNGGIYYLKSEL